MSKLIFLRLFLSLVIGLVLIGLQACKKNDDPVPVDEEIEEESVETFPPSYTKIEEGIHNFDWKIGSNHVLQLENGMTLVLGNYNYFPNTPKAVLIAFDDNWNIAWSENLYLFENSWTQGLFASNDGQLFLHYASSESGEGINESKIVQHFQKIDLQGNRGTHISFDADFVIQPRQLDNGEFLFLQHGRIGHAGGSIETSYWAWPADLLMVNLSEAGEKIAQTNLGEFDVLRSSEFDLFENQSGSLSLFAKTIEPVGNSWTLRTRLLKVGYDHSTLENDVLEIEEDLRGLDTIESEDGGLIVKGSIFVGNSSDSFTKHLKALKFDANNELVWRKTLYDSAQALGQLIKVNEYYYTVGSKQLTSSSTKGFFLGVFNEDGDSHEINVPRQLQDVNPYSIFKSSETGVGVFGNYEDFFYVLRVAQEQ